VNLERSTGLSDEAAVLRDAIHEFFRQRTLGQRKVRELLRVGRTSLAIGLIGAGFCCCDSPFFRQSMKGSNVGQIPRETLVIGEWVSRWWPIRNEAQLSDRLASMPGRTRYLNAAAPEAWKGDWPAVSSARAPVRSWKAQTHTMGYLYRGYYRSIATQATPFFRIL